MATSTRPPRRPTSSPTGPRDLDVPALQARGGRGARPRAWRPAATRPARSPLLERRPSTSSTPAALPWLRATLLVELARAARRAPATSAARRSTRQAAAARWRTLDVVLAAADAPLLDRLAERPAATRPAPQPAGDADPGRQVVGRVAAPGRRVRLPDTKGLRYLAELVAAAGRRAPRARPRRPGRGRRRRRRGRPAGARRRRASCSTAGPGPRTAAAIEELRADADDALGRGRLEAAEALQAELDQLVAPAGPGLRARRPRPAGRVGRRAGPAERHPGAARGDRQAGRGPARGRRGPRPAGPHRPVLRLRAARRTTTFAGSFSPD